MALTPAETRSAFEICHVIYNDVARVNEGFYRDINIDTSYVKSDVVAMLAALDADSEIKVKALIVEWDKVALTTGRIEGGGVGQIQGASFSFDEVRARIKEMFRIYVPIMHVVDRAIRNSGAGGTYFTLDPR